MGVDSTVLGVSQAELERLYQCAAASTPQHTTPPMTTGCGVRPLRRRNIAQMGSRVREAGDRAPSSALGMRGAISLFSCLLKLR